MSGTFLEEVGVYINWRHNTFVEYMVDQYI